MAAEIHELTAAYALDALDEREEREYEEHLRRCERCRHELAELTEAASALAYAVDTPAPPDALRGRILEQARQERSNVVPLRPRRPVFVSVAAAAAAAVIALAVGLWASSLSNALDRERELTAILADPTARSVPVSGAGGRLVVTERGDAVLVVSRLDEAPTGQTYELWDARAGAPVPAGLFDAPGGRDVVVLEESVPPGARVLVTLEPEGGVDAPTSAPLASARA